MGIRVGYTSGSLDRTCRHLHCSSCEKFLGVYEINNDVEFDEIEGWEFCPYCGCELDR